MYYLPDCVFFFSSSSFYKEKLFCILASEKDVRESKNYLSDLQEEQ